MGTAGVPRKAGRGLLVGLAGAALALGLWLPGALLTVLFSFAGRAYHWVPLWMAVVLLYRDILTSVAATVAAIPSQTPQIVYVTPQPTPTSQPTNTPSPTATATKTAIPPTPVIIYICPTPVYYPPPVYPTPIPAWNPSYADQFIYYYYQRINNREYITAWSLLTEAFKLAVNPDGYSGFVNYWNTVARVDIRSVSLTSFTGYTATVLVDMVYTYFNGTVASSLQPFRLYYDSYRATWMFDSNTVPTPAPVYYTPDQFIYHYFYNINLRNYPYTWSLLSPSFIAKNNPPSDGGYWGYVDFWNSVSRVDVTYASVVSNSGLYADVSVGLKFTYDSGLVTNAYATYHLLWNYSLANWQFYSP